MIEQSDVANSEATALERMLSSASGVRAQRLVSDPTALLSRVPELGVVTARTRSRAAVLDSVGSYGPPDIGEHTGIVIGANIDLRIFPSGWKHAYAVTGSSDAGSQRSLQIYDGEGMPAHEIVLRPESDGAAYERLTRALALRDDSHDGPAPKLERHVAPAETPDAAIDVAAYRAAYAAMTDTHDFFMRLRRFGLAREQGLRLAGERYATELARDAHRPLFARAAEAQIPLMLFVSSDGMVQISSGPVPAPVYADGCCRMVDAHFACGLDERLIARVWAVRKPTSNGIVTSLELYDAEGTLGLQLFGERHAGEGERTDWARAISELKPAAAAT
jgi:putative hemin transport protein